MNRINARAAYSHLSENKGMCCIRNHSNLLSSWFCGLPLWAPWKKSYDKPRQCIKKQRHHFSNKGPYSQSYGFSNSHVRMWELNHKEGWAWKNWCFWTVMLEKTLESPLDCKEIKPVNPKGNQPWIFTGRTDTEASDPILLSPDVKGHLIGKDPDAGKVLMEEEKGTREDDHWMASTTQWTWLWASSGRWWRTQ